MAPASTPARSVELFVRSLSPAEPPVADHLQRVRHLETAGQVSDADVTVWGTEVGLSTTASRTETGRLVLDRVADFRSWADELGVTMEPFFQTREVTSGLTGEEYTTLVLPVCCLAEYRGPDLVHVSPYSTGDAICSVGDRLDRLADFERDRDRQISELHSRLAGD
jgi:hypothetical protein